MLNKEWFINKINSFLREDESNRMTGVDGILFWEPDVIVGICSGDDPIFEYYKKVVGPFHLTPVEAYSKHFSVEIESPENLSVIAFILPTNKITKKENFEHSKEWPGERWSHTRLYGEQSNQKLQKYLLSEVKREFGVDGIAPMTEQKLYKVHQKHPDAYQGVWASTWSHRHMCFAAGLGSFGLSDGFINPRGKAMRCGSIVINYKLPSEGNARPSDPFEYCTKCGQCVERCPVGAITLENGHDKQKCHVKVSSTVPYIQNHYHIPIYSCGLCQVNVSCSDGIPLKK
ncbi:MAG: 4Fe-4S binding protein [Candidatus Lokiarchaeota archaeon]|nr:4Fe-4S binding protein [Candidatus Lokiarchaeota archaeon]